MSPRFHPFVRLILCVLAVVLAQAIIVVALSDNNPVAVSGSPISGRAMLLMVAITTPVTLLAVALCRRWMDGQSLASLGLRTRGAVPDLVRGTLCGALAIAFVFGVLWVAGALQIVGISQRAQHLGGAGIAMRLGVWALAMLCVGLVEEVLFRGYALQNLSVWLGADKIGLGAAAIIQGLVFGLVHLNNFGVHPTPEQAASAWQAMPNIALIGVFFALCYYKTGALWFPIGFHAAWNFFLGSVFSLPVSGQQSFQLLDVRVNASHWLTGGSFGVEGSLILTVLTIAMIYLVRRTDDHPQVLADIKSLIPAGELDEVEVASRAPRLRERKEKRTAQIPQKVTFEGWNDLKPEGREPYSVYKPPLPADLLDSLSEPAAVSMETPVENFSEFRPVIEAPPASSVASKVPLEPVPEASISQPLPTVPETKTPVVETPISPPKPVSSDSASPPPPAKKPPSVRW